jgi:hypothetical protein
MQNRVLGRTGARELTHEETLNVTGRAGTNCTFHTTFPNPHTIDDLVDDCGPN